MQRQRGLHLKIKLKYKVVGGKSSTEHAKENSIFHCLFLMFVSFKNNAYQKSEDSRMSLFLFSHILNLLITIILPLLFQGHEILSSMKPELLLVFLHHS